MIEKDHCHQCFQYVHLSRIYDSLSEKRQADCKPLTDEDAVELIVQITFYVLLTEVKYVILLNQIQIWRQGVCFLSSVLFDVYIITIAV